MNLSPLERVLGGGALDVHFQPIFSLKQKRIVGLEALTRPGAVNIGQAFASAREAGCLLELDRLCRQRALERYAALRATAGLAPEPLLFLNVEASVIAAGVVGSGALLRATRAAGVDPQDVVIETNESQMRNDEALTRFVDQQRSHGFLIALDDLGAGHSNLARIAQLRPHIIKLDRGLIASLDRDFFKQETVKCLARLGRGIGALVLAEGVETLEEVDCCAALGAELFQGYALSRPMAARMLDLNHLNQRLLNASQRLRQQGVSALQRRRVVRRRLEAMALRGCRELLARPPEEFAAVLAALVRRDSSVEAAYLLDSRGQQVGATHLGANCAHSSNRLFAPSQDGTDHSTKEYFFSLLDTGLKRFITDSYISMATGKLCITVAMTLDHSCGATYVLCIDRTLRR